MNKIKKQIRLIFPYTRLLKLPIIMGIIGSLILFLANPYLQIMESDQSIFEISFGVLGIIYGLISGEQISTLREKHANIKRALDPRIKDRKLFDMSMCVTIEPEIHLLLSLISVLFYGYLLIYPFHSMKTGVIMSGSIVFLLVLMWEIAIDFDDPYNGVSKITPKKIREIFPNFEKEMD
jgi:hypothetical protein